MLVESFWLRRKSRLLRFARKAFGGGETDAAVAPVNADLPAKRFMKSPKISQAELSNGLTGRGDVDT